ATGSTITDAAGDYRLTLLPPGLYTLKYSLTGFAAITRQGVRVSLDKDTMLDATLKVQALQEEVTVTGEASVIDTTSTTLGQNLDTRAIETLPSGRNYSSVVQVTPGVSSDANPENRGQSTISVYGSSG